MPNDRHTSPIPSPSRSRALRVRLLAKLAAAEYAYDRTEIFLDQGMIDEAVRSVDVENTLRNPMNKVLLRLTGAAHASHPDWVVDVCERMAANVMDSGQAGFYGLAVEWLEKAALAYDAAGRFDDWIARIDGLIEKHRRKYKLKPLLETLRPGALEWWSGPEESTAVVVERTPSSIDPDRRYSRR